MATDHLTAPFLPHVQEGIVTLGTFARHQGDVTNAGNRVAQLLPQGPATEPGDSYFAIAITAITLAANLALDGGDLTQARRWIETHDHWLDWSGGQIWQADGLLLWARLAALSNDPEQARERAQRAFAHASDPRQPLRLAICSRFLGRLDMQERQYEVALSRLTESLTLTEACAASFEQALTLLALAELHMATGNEAHALGMLDDVRAICVPLNAIPMLAQVDALEAILATRKPSAPIYPNGLTRREVDVLRLIAAGTSNREIAGDLFLSPRTVERHIANIYVKIDAHSKADATAYALRNDIA